MPFVKDKEQQSWLLPMNGGSVPCPEGVDESLLNRVAKAQEKRRKKREKQRAKDAAARQKLNKKRDAEREAMRQQRLAEKKAQKEQNKKLKVRVHLSLICVIDSLFFVTLFWRCLT